MGFFLIFSNPSYSRPAGLESGPCAQCANVEYGAGKRFKIRTKSSAEVLCDARGKSEIANSPCVNSTCGLKSALTTRYPEIRAGWMISNWLGFMANPAKRFPMKIASITIKVKYGIQPGRPNGTHSYSHSFIPALDIFCPQCGQSQVWVEDGPGDYYAGPTHYCLACRRSFHMDVSSYVYLPGDTSSYGQILDQISAHINGRS